MYGSRLQHFTRDGSSVFIPSGMFVQRYGEKRSLILAWIIFLMVKAVNSPNVKLLYDIYHMQRMEGELINTITSLGAVIDHIQLAATPGRHEPGTGEINFDNLFKAIDDAASRGAKLACFAELAFEPFYPQRRAKPSEVP